MSSPELPDFEKLGEVDAEDFAAAVAAVPDEQIAEGMQSEHRENILDEIFKRMEEHFDPTKSADVDLVIHFHITGRPDGGVDDYQVVIRDDTCKTSKELTDEMGLGLELDAVEFIKLVANLTNGMDLYIGGKLKIDGNMIVATRITGLFAMPEAGKATTASTTATEE